LKYTNEYNLPPEVFKALTKERYVGGETDYSVTTLKSPPRIVQLERRHWDSLEQDAMDNLWSMFGTMAHNLLEEHGSDDSMTEERVYMDILGRRVSGQVDHYKDGIITDYKVTSAWSLVYGSRVKDWEEQLNMYAYLLSASGHEVKQIQIITILRDWDKNKAKEAGNYPKSPIVVIPITLWEQEDQKSYLEYRVALHIDAEGESDGALPLCTEEEMWCQPTKYAVFKGENKRATKLFEDEADIFFWLRDEMGWITESPEGHIITTEHRIERRQGKRTRCEGGYCSVSQYCNVYKAYLEEQ